MSTITADPALQSMLSQVSDVTEIRDANGNLLGIYTPKEVAEEQQRYAAIVKLFNPAEAKRRLREEGDKGSPLEEVWKRIHARAKK